MVYAHLALQSPESQHVTEYFRNKKLHGSGTCALFQRRGRVAPEPPIDPILPAQHGARPDNVVLDIPEDVPFDTPGRSNRRARNYYEALRIRSYEQVLGNLADVNHECFIRCQNNYETDERYQRLCDSKLNEWFQYVLNNHNTIEDPVHEAVFDRIINSLIEEEGRLHQQRP